jgi:hypothetical protein
VKQVLYGLTALSLMAAGGEALSNEVYWFAGACLLVLVLLATSYDRPPAPPLPPEQDKAAVPVGHSIGDRGRRP